MKNCIILAFPGNDQLSTLLSNQLNIETGPLEIRDFPDQESYVRIHAKVQDKTVILVCGLAYPNNKILSVLFVADTLKNLGANHICLISPYLPYMRQDKCFKPGEAITSALFAKYLSGSIDSLITIDPHLHRLKNLSEIYCLDSISVLHSTTKIAAWVAHHIDSPFIIGPDEESRQWAAEVAEIADAPYSIIKKSRHGDREVSITVPDIRETNKTLVLIDDIISTGTSMLAAVQALKSRGFGHLVCLAVHALFDHTVHDKLLHAGAQHVVTCNTILHPTNQIDITGLIVEELKRLYLN